MTPRMTSGEIDQAQTTPRRLSMQLEKAINRETGWITRKMFPITTALVAAIAVASTAQAAVHSLQTPGGQCLTGSTEAGSTPTFANCNVQNDQRSPTTQQQWIIAPGNNEGVQLFGTELCLDAGANPEAGRTAVLASCSNSASQTWYLTDDNRIAITGGDQCLEAQATEATTQLCSSGVANQAWIPVFLFDEDSSAGGAGVGGAGSSSAASSATGSASSGGPLAGVTSSLSSAASAVTNGASSAAASGASAASSSVASGASAASSAVSAASSSASGALASASSAVSSASGALSSASGPLAGVASSLSSAASAASATPTGGASVKAVGAPAVIGAFIAAMFL